MTGTLLFLGLGMQEILFIALIVLLFFGGKKIPELMKGLGKGVKSFKEGMNGVEDLIPDMDKAISEKVETFLDKSGDQPYAHMNEGYVVVVEMTGEMDATDAISDYLRKRTELMY